MEEMQITQIGKEVATFVVFYGEDEKYVSLMEQFRQANSRKMLIEVIHSFLYLSESIRMKDGHQTISPTKWQTLCRFIQHGNIQDVQHLHDSMVSYVAMLEIEKIKYTEQYLLELLGGCEEEYIES